MADKPNVGFQLVFPENLKKDANLTVSDKLAFDDLGDFIEEREKVERILEKCQQTELRIDYSDFANHVFFDSAKSKFAIAKSKILTKYPFNGTRQEKDEFFVTGSGYEGYILEERWPHQVGYVTLDGSSQFISASDPGGQLAIGSSSLYVSAWVKPDDIDGIHPIVEMISQSFGPTKTYGYSLILSGTTTPMVEFTLFSASSEYTISASYAEFTSSFNNVGVIYDATGSLLTLYINADQQLSESAEAGPIEFNPIRVVVGSSSLGYKTFSGSLNEIRILHTGSNLYHRKNYDRPVDSEEYVKLNYRFNEGVVGTGSIDQIVVDYSKSGLHGQLFNYTSATRISGAVMSKDPGDPILYDFQARVEDFSADQDLSASLYDLNNNNQILNMVSEGVLSEDESVDNLMIPFLFTMARFFDEIKLYIDQLDNLRVTNYEEQNEVPDLFLPFLKKYFGWKVSEHFGDANPSEFFFGEDILSSGSLDVSLFEIRNQFWRRILNNLPYLYKTKGKRHNLDAFLNVVGVGRNNLKIKEYGFAETNSVIEDSRIAEDKPVALLGFGTGSAGDITGSFVVVPSLITTSESEYTIETLAQLPFLSASYSGTLLQGAIWELVKPDQTEALTLLWSVAGFGASSGRLILTSSDGQSLSSSDMAIFDGDFVNIAAGLRSDQTPFIDVRTIDAGDIDFSASFTGSVAFTGVATGSDFDFVMGANSGSMFQNGTQGFYGEYRYWSQHLSASELDAHALHFENIGLRNPLEEPHPLRGHWPLNEFVNTNANGELTTITDHSRNGLTASGSGFIAETNPYDKFLLEFHYLSHNIDLKWTENKVRIRNATELTIDQVGKDTNEISVEFNLVDALNRDITKLFSTMDLFNNAVGAPVNKYRDEYADLEALRTVYFDRIGDSIYFTDFFKLFKWFDKKISTAIKQLLPARVKYIGAEQVVESHLLERPKYQYKYPIFRTPPRIPEARFNIRGRYNLNSKCVRTIEAKEPFVGTHNASNAERRNLNSLNINTVPVRQRPCSADLEISCPPRFRTTFGDGAERVDRSSGFFRKKVSGDSKEYSPDAGTSINFKNGFARQTLQDRERRNIGNAKSDTFINPVLGNAFRIENIKSTQDQEHFFSGAKKHIVLSIRGLSGSDIDPTIDDNNQFILVGAEGIELSQSLFDLNNSPIDTGSFIGQAFDLVHTTVEEKYDASVSFEVSGVNTNFNAADIGFEFKDDNSPAWSTYNDLLLHGEFLKSSDGFYKFESRLFSGSQVQRASVSFDRTNVNFRLSASAGKTYAFKNVRMDFCQPISDGGTKKFREIGNQHTEKIFANINRNAMPKVE